MRTTASTLSPPENNALALPGHRERTRFSVRSEHDGFTVVWCSARDGRVFKTLFRGLTAGEVPAALIKVGTACLTRLQAALTPLLDWTTCERVGTDSGARIIAGKRRRKALAKLRRRARKVEVQTTIQS